MLRASWCWIILREGVLVPDVYDATLNPLYRDVLAHYGAVALPCRIQDPDRKGKVESRRRPRQENAAQGTTLREPGRSASLSGSLGNELGRYAHPRHHQTASGRHVRRRKTHSCSRCLWNRSAITSTANGSCIWMAVSKSKPPTTVYPQAGSDVGSKSNGMNFTFVSSIPRTGHSCANMCVRNGAGIAFSPRTTLSKLRSVWSQLLGRAGRAGHPRRHTLQPYL